MSSDLPQKLNSPPPGADADFETRLRWLLAGRSATPWAKRLGLGGGSIKRLTSDGGKPSADALVRIMRTENVSLRWLLDGEGPPFHVTRTGSEDETLQELEDEAADDGWRVALLQGANADALLLFQPVEMDVKGAPLRYVSVRVIAGPVGDAVRERLLQLGVRLAAVANLSPETMAALYAGRLGTWQLLGNGKGGLVSLAERGSLRAAVGEPQAMGYGAMPPLARLWPVMTDVERTALNLLLGPFLREVDSRRR